ncbi:formylglycine-generating enzyme family protein [Flavobacteriaceae bacterium F89]|uniref:Formylglycine-generating enzyme family protein n=1 Tax=Cerina litoralis TaxID=2874477 RepID=A0AAE3EVY9_9FLAO|nr:formylglycine-generating enzyme family protein [Cerina litoralis]MCG2460687.1 formylglycine-generating enzyme family protein [Cerina litoralis]
MPVKLTSYFLLLFALPWVAIWAQEDQMAKVKGGVYTPLYGADSTAVGVSDFYMDLYPVTNSEYLAFVNDHPEWKKSRVKKLFADGLYLRNWESDTKLGKKVVPNAPVTNVSWFAAKKYCECQGKRLPTMDEWEFAARADETMADARNKPGYNKYILGWYEAPHTFKNPIGSTFKNYYGIYDLHGLVWEWTSDFNSVLLSGESRKGNDEDANLFCGSAAIGATDLMNYAAFMRYAFRASIKANYTVQNLGFRCAKNVIDNKGEQELSFNSMK